MVIEIVARIKLVTLMLSTKNIRFVRFFDIRNRNKLIIDQLAISKYNNLVNLY